MESAANSADKGKGVALEITLPSGDQERLTRELFPEWVEYQDLWVEMDRLQIKRIKVA